MPKPENKLFINNNTLCEAARKGGDKIRAGNLNAGGELSKNVTMLLYTNNGNREKDFR